MSFTGIGSAFGSYFGSKDATSAFNDAIAQLQEFQKTAGATMAGFAAKGNQAFAAGMGELTAPTMAPDIAAMRSFLTTQIQSGLSPFAQLQMAQANAFLENKATQSGNLRSGAIGLQRAQLGEAVVADEFSRALQTLDVLRKGDQTSAQLYLNTAINYGSQENQALATTGSAVSNVASAIVGKGMVQQQAAAALGAGIGGLADMAASGAAGYMGASDGSSVSNLMKSYGYNNPQTFTKQ